MARIGIIALVAINMVIDSNGSGAWKQHQSGQNIFAAAGGFIEPLTDPSDVKVEDDIRHREFPDINPIL